MVDLYTESHGFVSNTHAGCIWCKNTCRIKVWNITLANLNIGASRKRVNQIFHFNISYVRFYNGAIRLSVTLQII